MVDSTLLCDVTGDNYVPALDDEISKDEIDSGINHLKEDKSSADGWAKKMITNLPICTIPCCANYLQYHPFYTHLSHAMEKYYRE